MAERSRNSAGVRRVVRLLHAGVLALAASPAFADDSGPVGKWLTIDERTNSPGSIVEITDSNGTLEGKIVKLVQLPGQDPSAMQTTCTKCTGALKGKPINGLPIFWNLKRDGDEMSSSAPQPEVARSRAPKRTDFHGAAGLREPRK
jgi:hypothetical protein